ncbi:MAG: peptidoglycan-associated lipoprotein Pal [Pseudomonadota bacterium]
MRAISLKALSALVIVAAIAGCASKKTDDSAQTTVAPAAQTTPVETAPVQAEDVGMPMASDTDMQPMMAVDSAEGFESNPANYTGDTRTRVVYFAFDRAEIPQAAYATLKAHAKHLAGNPAARLTLEGHADERGTPEYNVALSERRAASVVNFLTLNGAKAAQIEVVSFGEEKPAELGHDELSWAKNRRAVLSYTASQP